MRSRVQVEEGDEKASVRLMPTDGAVQAITLALPDKTASYTARDRAISTR